VLPASRLVEQRGLVRPFRTDGGTRRYSRDDIDRIADITNLLAKGVNLAGIGHVLKLRDQSHRLAAELSELQATSEPDRQEVRRLRRENRDLKAELVRRDQPDPPDQPDSSVQPDRSHRARRHRRKTSSSSDDGSAEA
jgi:MerR family transcriptional regulator, heat shock protein HspR